ncbi:hypothetical protein [Longimicrobium sp.]|uniref:hypothetical protein n=1 Tax=Longimicrobium sp. TaxID=2029185 RepID=UPI003B3B2DAC
MDGVVMAEPHAPPHTPAAPRAAAGTLLQLTRMRPRGARPPVLLGGWCRDEADPADGARVLDAYFDAGLQEPRAEVARAYAAGLRQLAVWLNGVTRLDRAPEEWEFVVYRFLTYLVSEAYFRHLYLARALRAEPGLVPVALDPADYLAPPGEAELASWYESSDYFNLQLFSQAARVLAPGAPVQRRSAFDAVAGDPALAGSRGPVMEVRTALRQWIRRPRPAVGPGAVVLFPAHFPPAALAALGEGSGYRLAPASFPRSWRRPAPYDPALRAGLRVTEPGEGFVRGFLDALRFNTPCDFLEELPRHRALADRVARRGRPDLVAGGFFRGVPERLWIQSCRQGPAPTRLAIVQHGGNYGESADTLVAWTEVERRVSDTFVSWGWGDGEAKVTPMPAPRLMSGPRDGAGDALLIVSGMVREYPAADRFRGAPPPALGQERFLAALPAELLPRVRFRAHPRDGGTVEQQAPWRHRFPRVSLDRGERGVHQEIADARLVVVNYPFSTTFPECVAADRPVLVISDGRAPAAHPRAREAYARLHEAGVVFHDAEEAARAAAEAYQDVQAWWNEPARRAAVLAYRRDFARTADDAVEQWRGFLRTQVSTASGGSAGRKKGR